MTGHLVGRKVTKRYAGLVANDGVDIEVRPGEVVGLIGPNGAGKTTLFNCLTGFTSMTSGGVVLDGRDVTELPPASRAMLGMARTFQQAKLFGHLTVAENLLLGRHRHYGARAWQSALGLGRRAEQRAAEVVREVASQCGLHAVLDAPVSDLPYGTQRMVEVARALATEPAIILLDEPGAGMDTKESAYFGQLIRRIHDERGLSMLIIEHDVALVGAVCDRVYVLDFGITIMDGTPAEVRADAGVREAYLGTSATEVVNV
ncbi:MAG: branched-chain amino acid transport system ATP-binding protein [Actinomycetota bacterium]|nr:branched-chain amino acid transport system ATP-binding protein [Actinomycetota bacterium]